MTHDIDPTTVLPESTCWELLAGARLGRLVTVVDGRPGIFPVNFAVQHRTILFRTAEGTKLVSAAINNNVLFEADGATPSDGWSVIVAGVARYLRTVDDIAEAEQAQMTSWLDTDRAHFVRIRPRAVTGRHFRFGTARAEAAVVEDPVLE